MHQFLHTIKSEASTLGPRQKGNSILCIPQMDAMHFKEEWDITYVIISV